VIRPHPNPSAWHGSPCSLRSPAAPSFLRLGPERSGDQTTDRPLGGQNEIEGGPLPSIEMGRSGLTNTEELIARRDAATGRDRRERESDLQKLLRQFQAEIAAVRVLDPACGSGNFLYVALKRLLDLEKEVLTFMATNRLTMAIPEVAPEQLFGLEINTYAHELAQVVVWIGYIQWLNDNGFGIPDSPILKPLTNIRRMDAIMSVGSDGTLSEPPWPEADVIIGNPPFIGGNRIRQRLGDEYVERLFRLYEGRVPAFADLVCYWFERARAMIASKHATRVGLLATQAIRGRVNRTVLERIKGTGDIFWAWSDRDWILDGTAVHVSMIGFDNGSETTRSLNDRPVLTINSDLTAYVDITRANILAENLGISFQGPSAKSPLDIDETLAKAMLGSPVNVNGRPNSDVIKPVLSATDLVGNPRRKWTIDFALMPLDEASMYESPFKYVESHVYPIRSKNRRKSYADKWWQYAEARPGMRKALLGKSRYIATACHAKHRIFVWVDAGTLCNQATIVFARDDDYFFGILQSRMHELWSRAKGTQVREAESGFRYTPTSTFETFPFPWPPGSEPLGTPQVEAIAQAARELVQRRDAWLNPPGASASTLKERTLTNLYNQNHTWLQLLHQKLDHAVMDAYGWEHSLSDEEILERLLALNLARDPA
jgi:hypothetical protein